MVYDEYSNWNKRIRPEKRENEKKEKKRKGEREKAKEKEKEKGRKGELRLTINDWMRKGERENED